MLFNLYTFNLKLIYFSILRIYLIDHAWTYRANNAREQLHQISDLGDRMAHLMDIETEGRSEDDIIENVLKEMWRFNQCYSYNGPFVVS